MKPSFLLNRVAWPWLLVSLTAGLGLGWGLARFRSGGGAKTQPASAATPAPPEPLQNAALAREAAFRKATAFAQTIPLGEDLRESLRAVQQLDNADERRIAWQAFLQRLPKERWGELAKVLKRLYADLDEYDDPLAYTAHLELLRGFAQHLSLEDPTRAISLGIDGESLPTPLGKVVFQLWAERDQAAATAFFHSLNPEDDSMDASEFSPILARMMARTDPKAALDWIGQLPDTQRQETLESVFTMLCETSPAEAGRWWNSLPDGADRQAISKQIVNYWAKLDPDQALTWAKTLPTESHREALATAIQPFAEKDFAGALAQVAGAAPEHQAALLLGVARELSPSHDAEAFSAHVDHLPESDMKALIADRLMGVWTQTDSIAASAWLARLSQGPTRDAAVGTFSANLAWADPEAAAEWASTIGKTTDRQQWMRQVLSTWRHAADAEAANTWIRQSSRLTPEDREWLLSPEGQKDPLMRGVRGLRFEDGPISNAIDGLRFENDIKPNAIDSLLESPQ